MCEVMLFPMVYIFALCLFRAKNNRLNLFGKNQVTPIVMENNFVRGIHMRILGIYGRNSWIRQKKHVCLKNYGLSHDSKSVI